MSHAVDINPTLTLTLALTLALTLTLTLTLALTLALTLLTTTTVEPVERQREEASQTPASCVQANGLGHSPAIVHRPMSHSSLRTLAECPGGHP